MKSTNSWRTLLLKAMAGLALFALANLAVYHASEYFHKAREYDATVQGALQKQRVNLVLAGDSHVAALQNALLADTAYNVSSGGDGPREIYAKLRRIMEAGGNVKTLVLSADIHMFAAARQASSNRAFADWYLLETGSPYGLDRGRVATLLNAVPLFNDDFVQFLKKSISARRKKGNPSPAAGGAVPRWSDLSESDRTEIARRTGEYDHRGAGLQPQAMAWYGHIADLARRHGARVIAVRYPAHPAYFSGVDVSTVTRIDAELEKLGFPQPLDYRRTFSDPAVFADEDHLNEAGAVALLQRLGKDTGERLCKDTVAQFAGTSRR